MNDSGDRRDARFIICVESGLLEYKALCLILTLRRNAGRWKDLPIVVYSPRPGRHVSAWLKSICLDYSVSIVEDDLNVHYPDYPLANKPLAMADAEARFSEEMLIFLDSDILVRGEPLEFSLSDMYCLAAVPDADKSVASTGAGDELDVMWLKLYELAGVTEHHFLETTLSRQRVRAWWCSGVVACRRSSGIMREWLEVFEKSFSERNLFVARASYLREQMAFSATAARHMKRMRNLPPAYNYHVQNYDKYIQIFGLGAEKATLWHYQCYLDKAFVRFKSRLDSSRSTEERIQTAWRFIDQLECNYRRMIGKNEPWYTSLRRRLRLGVRVRKVLGMVKSTDRDI